MTDMNETLPSASEQETTQAGVLGMGSPAAPVDGGTAEENHAYENLADDNALEEAAMDAAAVDAAAMDAHTANEGEGAHARADEEPRSADSVQPGTAISGGSVSEPARQESEHFDDEPYPKIDPKELALNVAFLVSEDETQVGNFIQAIDEGDGVTDFRFEAAVPGYENWQWSVTLFHDEVRDTWTVCESSLVPVAGALLAPPWIPWKDRLEPSDLSPTDSIGTEEDDPRLEDGFRSDDTQARTERQQVAETDERRAEQSDPQIAQAAQRRRQEHEQAQEIAEEYSLSRRRVLSTLGRSQAAERWYGGPHGPKALSTRTAGGKICQTCGFYVCLQGDLGRMFGVCANKWSPDDGKVVSGDHGCGEHSEIAPPAPTPMWIQTQPALDDNTIEVVRQGHRDESAAVEMMEDFDAPGTKSAQPEQASADDGDDAVVASAAVAAAEEPSVGDNAPGAENANTAGAANPEVPSGETADADVANVEGMTASNIVDADAAQQETAEQQAAEQEAGATQGNGDDDGAAPDADAAEGTTDAGDVDDADNADDTHEFPHIDAGGAA